MTAEQLKNGILQMAVQGKHVPQDPNDEPASELIKRIREEKGQLIKEGKIKKEKNPSHIFRGEDNENYQKLGKEVPYLIVKSSDAHKTHRTGTRSSGRSFRQTAVFNRYSVCPFEL